jgi:peptide/nickel transport system ATP-binding protein
MVKLYLMVSVANLSRKEFQSIRGNAIAIIFQEPMSSLNPSLSCGFQVQEILLQHKVVIQSRGERNETLLLSKSKVTIQN